jgi:nitrite reductase (NO-forming)
VIRTKVLAFLSLVCFLLSGCQGRDDKSTQPVGEPAASGLTKTYTLLTRIFEGRMVFEGIGGEIDGQLNPDLIVQPGDTVQLVLLNGDGISHDLAVPGLEVATPIVYSKESTAEVVFYVLNEQIGTYDYICTVAGHRQAGMEGRFIVREAVAAGE